jgi:predicted anti-sigma-YlaC factor YlaD
MNVGRPSRSCERARGSISADLDGELSEVEQAMLRRHLRQCSSCSAFRVESRAFTDILRQAELEEYSVDFSPVTARRRWSGQVRRAIPAVAAAVLFVTVGGTLGRMVGERSQPEPVAALANVRSISSSPPRASGTFVAARKPSLPLGQRSASEDF